MWKNCLVIPLVCLLVSCNDIPTRGTKLAAHAASTGAGHVSCNDIPTRGTKERTTRNAERQKGADSFAFDDDDDDDDASDTLGDGVNIREMFRGIGQIFHRKSKSPSSHKKTPADPPQSEIQTASLTDSTDSPGPGASAAGDCLSDDSAAAAA